MTDSSSRFAPHPTDDLRADNRAALAPRRLVHGTPITPGHLLEELAGGSFCVSYAAPRQLDRCIELVGEDGILLLDNGAFSHWRAGQGQIDREGFWAWANAAQTRCSVAVAVIPDVIGGSEVGNWTEAAHAVRTLSRYPERIMFVWHLNDSLENLTRAARLFNFVGLGSGAQYDVQRHPDHYLNRLKAVNAHLDYVERWHARRPFVHLLRGLGVLHRVIRFDSADSTNVARNHHRKRGELRHVGAMADSIARKVRAHQRRRGTTLPTTNFEPELPHPVSVEVKRVRD